ncbi:MAG: T9SS type A sorting domain-containing protein [Saprospiraceae bacterium]|jgi:hypothetical protein|nr:T9SS type A sorting domain-containing protein [Saprospiraceae bacterium]
MKITKSLFLFLSIILCNAAIAQTLVIDSSFGTNGLIELRTTTRLQLTSHLSSNIYFIDDNLIYYFDSLGNTRKDILHSSPEPFVNTESYFGANVPSIIQDSLLLISYIKHVTGSFVNYVRQINLNNPLDSSPWNKGLLRINEFSSNKRPSTTDLKQNLFFVFPNYSAGINNFDFNLVSVDQIGVNGSIKFNKPTSCNQQVNYYNISTPIVDLNNNIYFSILYFCDQNLAEYLIKINSKFKIDSTFGNNGFLQIIDTFCKPPVYALIDNRVVIGELNNLYLIYYNGTSPSTPLECRKFDSNGIEDSNYRFNAKENIIQFRKFSAEFPSCFDNKKAILYFVTYDDQLNESTLHSISKDGKLLDQYLPNKPLTFTGKVFSFLALDSGGFLLGMNYKDSSTIYKLNYTEIANATTNYSSLNAPVKINVKNAIIQISNTHKNIRSLTIYDFQGRSVLQINNKEEIADPIEIHSLTSGIYFLHLEFADNSSYVHKFYK